MTDNGIDWILLVREWWPVFTCFLGWGAGFGLNHFYTRKLLSAQHGELGRLRGLVSKLSSDNQRIIDYTNNLITRERNGRKR